MKKALSIAGKILTILIAVFSVGIMIFTIVSVNTIGKDAALFGYKPYIVTSNSMQDTFQAGDLTVSKQVDPATLEPGDIVTFRSIDPVNYGQVVTHKIKSITTYAMSNLYNRSIQAQISKPATHLAYNPLHPHPLGYSKRFLTLLPSLHPKCLLQHPLFQS